MKESKKPTPYEYGWVDGEYLDEEDGAWITINGEEEYYKALRNWADEKLLELFDEKGMRKKDKHLYFKNGDLIDAVLIHQNCHTYPANSDIVRMYYAGVYADETHGNYTAEILYWRAF